MTIQAWNNPAHYRFTLGRFRGMVVTDGSVSFPPYPNYAPNAEPGEVEAAMQRYRLPPQAYSLNVNILYLETDRHRVIVDTGVGAAFGSGMGHAADNLIAAGIDLQTIDTVILTHGHIDHISGLVSADGTLTFPNATCYMDEREWAYWTSPGLTLSEPIMADALKQNFIQAARHHFPEIRDRVHLFTPDSELIPGITTLSAAGHTPGHTALRIESDDQTLLHLVDVFHHPGFDLEHPHWQTVFDHDPDQAYETRRRLLDAVSADGTLLLSYHMPFPGLGYVGKVNDHYRWIPQTWQF